MGTISFDSFLFKNIIPVDGVFIFHKKTFKKDKKKLLQFSIDLVIDFSDYDPSVYQRCRTLSYIKPKHSISFNQPIDTMYDTNIITKKIKHITTRMTKILELLTMENKVSYQLNFTDMQVRDAFALSNGIKIRDEKIIIFNPYASQNFRCLSNQQINELLQYLNTLIGYRTVVFNMGNEINSQDMKRVIVNPFSDAERSFALVKYADMVITVDTALVHLASAFHIRQYCIYNNRMLHSLYDNNTLWGPNSSKAVQLFTDENLKTELLIDAIEKYFLRNNIKSSHLI